MHDRAYLAFKHPDLRKIEKALTAESNSANGNNATPVPSVEVLTQAQVPALASGFAAVGALQWGAAATRWNSVISHLAVTALGPHEGGVSDGNSIRLDADAAGLGWFVDLTPGSNEEFTPGAIEGEWIAKPGSAAAGKMDLLSTLCTNMAMYWVCHTTSTAKALCRPR